MADQELLAKLDQVIEALHEIRDEVHDVRAGIIDLQLETQTLQDIQLTILHQDLPNRDKSKRARLRH